MRRTAAGDRFTSRDEDATGLARDRLVHHLTLHDPHTLGVLGQDRAGMVHFLEARRQGRIDRRDLVRVDRCLARERA
jgi:hypothetical protein